jgi:hypothetical protein
MSRRSPRYVGSPGDTVPEWAPVSHPRRLMARGSRHGIPRAAIDPAALMIVFRKWPPPGKRVASLPIIGPAAKAPLERQRFDHER